LLLGLHQHLLQVSAALLNPMQLVVSSRPLSL
jgi:hypothetical protein